VVILTVAVGVTAALVVVVTRHPTAAAHSVAAPTVRPVANRTTTPTPTPTPTPVPTPTPTTAPAPIPTLTPEQSEALAAQVLRAVRGEVPGAKIGLEVYDRRTGSVVTSVDPDEPFASMSVVKLFIALDVLARNHWALPDDKTQEQLSRMLSTSDDNLADLFWGEGGDGAIIDRDDALLGLTETKPPEHAGEWGDTRVTARDLVTLYQYIANNLPQPDHDLLYNAMFHATKTAADGTDQYFGIPDGLPGTTWAIKQGWGSSGPYADFNTTGLLGTDSRYIVILLTSAPLRYYRALPQSLTEATAQLASLVG
jgi:hypothetical protein